MEQHWDVVVVGAGLAGLTAAATAAATGASTLVVDAHQPGGRASTDERGRYRFNRGAPNLGRRYTEVTIEPVALNGELGIVLYDGRERVAAMAVHVEDGRVAAIHIIRAEDKLAALDRHPDLI